jgi:hypothetical protein
MHASACVIGNLKRCMLRQASPFALILTTLCWRRNDSFPRAADVTVASGKIAA